MSSWMEMGVSGGRAQPERDERDTGEGGKTPLPWEPSQKPTFEVRPQEEGMDARDQRVTAARFTSPLIGFSEA